MWDDKWLNKRFKREKMEQRIVTVEQHVLNNPSENVKDVNKQGTCWIELISILLFLKEDIVLNAP